MRRRRWYSYNRRGGGWLPSFCIAFGFGVLCAVFFSFRLALIVMAVLLIWMGRRFC